jgi:nucleoside-diphosphate-sugar epimerase
MNILITGIQGCLGAALAVVLKENHTIYGLDFVRDKMVGVEQIFTYNEFSQIPNIEIVLHVAGKSQDTLDMRKALEYFEMNAGLTRNVFNWFIGSSAKAFIFFSSVKAAADAYHGQALTEEELPKPFGLFGESKLLAENYVLGTWPRGKLVYVLRPAIIHGCGMMGNENMEVLYKWTKRGLPYILGKYESKRSYLTMDNLEFVLKRFLKLDIAPGVYNLADDDTLTTNETYELMCLALGKRKRKQYWAKWFIHLIARIGTLMNSPYNEYQYKKLSSNFVVSNLKLKKALGLSSMPVSSVDGFLKSIEIFKNNRETSGK